MEAHMQNLLKDLEQVLAEDQSLISDGKILKNAVVERALKADVALIKLLLQSPSIKEHFFQDVDGVLVFDKVKFQEFVSNKQFLPDSFTAFKNKIGLTDGNSYLKENKDVVLAWAYKDCVLEGGMTKEDKARDEIFYNTTLAPDDITRLFEPKVLTKFEKWDVDAVKKNKPAKVENISETDNLLIKGNNLLALHSLKARYAGKVKLIYIDPPYNTGGDSFKYNDSFNHSSWLTFMKNRLEVAKTFLRRDGIIFVQCDDNEQAYLKVLMDDMFQGGFLNCIAVKMSEATGVKMAHVKRRLPKLKEYLLVYKNPEFLIEEVQKVRAEEWNDEYKLLLENFTPETRQQLKELQDKEENTEADVESAIKLLSSVRIRSLAKYFNDEKIPEEEQEEWKFSNAWRIVQDVGSGSIKKYVMKLPEVPSQDIGALLTKEKILAFYKTSFNPESKDPRIRILFADDYLYSTIGDFWPDIKTSGGVGKEGGIDFPNGKKPEKLLERVIKLSTKPSDIVLDFFSGSGTAPAVAHKLGRQWIAIEQMNYIKDLPEARLKKVVEGEQSGVSKDANWQGGGSFVYCELMEWNEAIVQRIRDAKTAKDLLTIYHDIRGSSFLRYDVDMKAYETDDFAALELDDQKKALLACLEMNHLYVNIREIDDKEYAVSDEDKRLNKSFYGK